MSFVGLDAALDARLLMMALNRQLKSQRHTEAYKKGMFQHKWAIDLPLEVFRRCDDPLSCEPPENLSNHRVLRCLVVRGKLALVFAFEKIATGI